MPMSCITINLPDDDILKLQEAARQLGVTSEELICASIDDFLNRPEESFKKALDYVLQKNAELYRRLA